MQPKLTISILCSGRADSTIKCLESLKPLREAVDTELIITDTGCDPDLRTKIETYADKVLDFTWCDDFSAARNLGLKEAKGLWFFYLDDDEFLIDSTPLISWLNNKFTSTMDFADCKVRNYYDDELTIYNDAIVTRLARIRPELSFNGLVHEYMGPVSTETTAIDLLIGHTGYINLSPEARQTKALRNIPLIQKMLQKEPDEARWAIQLAQEYEGIGEFEKMYDLANLFYNKTLSFKDPSVYPVRCLFSEAMVLALLAMEKWGDLEITAYNMLNQMEGSNIWHSSLMLYALALANFEAATNKAASDPEDNSLARATEYAKQYFANYVAVESNPYCYHPIDKSIFVMDVFDSAHQERMNIIKDAEKILLSENIKKQLLSLIQLGYKDQALIALNQIKDLVIWDEEFDDIEKALQ